MFPGQLAAQHETTPCERERLLSPTRAEWTQGLALAGALIGRDALAGSRASCSPPFASGRWPRANGEPSAQEISYAINNLWVSDRRGHSEARRCRLLSALLLRRSSSMTATICCRQRTQRTLEEAAHVHQLDEPDRAGARPIRA